MQCKSMVRFKKKYQVKLENEQKTRAKIVCDIEGWEDLAFSVYKLSGSVLLR